MPYCGLAPSPDVWLTRWNLDPWLLAALVACAVFCLRQSAPNVRLRLGLALGGMAVIFVSPLCALSSALFTARTAHHLLLVGAVAPLVAWGLPRGRSGTLSAATLAHLAVLWAWHAPVAYDAALSSTPVYWTMQLSLLATAVWFWAQVRAAAAPAAVGALLAAMVGMGLLGGLLTFAPAALYTAHMIGPTLWGMTPLADQQLAGLVMWAPGSAIYLLAALAVLSRLLNPATMVRA